MAKGDNGLVAALERLASRTPAKPEVVKLPEKEPKWSPKTPYDPAKEPQRLYVDSKQLPFLANVRAGDEVFLFLKAKVGDITTRQSEDAKEPTVSTVLTILEVAKT